MSCMSAYSMPLWIILTKCPAPSVPTCVTQGSPSATAAIERRIGPRVSHASAEPPGMIDGPSSAPSSPPEMPAPTKLMPVSRTAFSRRIVSVNRALPPSTMMSPGSKTSVRASITASVPRPACTMMIAVRGFVSEAANSAYVWAATKPRLGVLRHESLGLLPRAVEDRDRVALAAGEVAGEIRAHDGEADDSDVGGGLGHCRAPEGVSARTARKVRGGGTTSTSLERRCPTGATIGRVP